MVNRTPIPCIYLIRNKKSGKVYIGKTADLRTRWKSHKSKLSRGCHSNVHLQRAWNKYGAKVFEFKVLEYVAVEELNEREEYHIAIYKKRNLSYNLTDGGEGNAGRIFSPEHRAKIAEANRRRIVSPETRRKMSESSKEQRHSEETRRKIGEANRRRVVTEETRNKIRRQRQGVFRII